jgi:hypothetical protein
VLDELPPKLPPAGVVVALSNRRAYDKLTKEVVAELLAQTAGERAYQEALDDGEGTARAEHAADHAARRAQRAAALVLVNKLRECASLGKVKPAIAWINDFLVTEQKLVVFSDFKATQAALIEAFPGCARIVAGMTPEAIQADKERFQTDPECRLIICSLRAAGKGHTLTAASDPLLIDIPWTPAEVQQAVDRCHRIGQTRPVTPWLIVGDDTVDVDVLATLERKYATSNAIVDGVATSGDDTQETALSAVLGRLLGA